MTMNPSATIVRFHVRALEGAYADRIRATLVDEFGNHLKVQTGVTAPCRSCLRITRTDEPVIVFAHRPFTAAGPYAEIGPIFVHALACEPYLDTEQVPPDLGSVA